MHNKTYVSAFGWTISIGGWFVWTLLLSGIFKPTKTYLLYPIYHNFTDHYGRSLLWWLVLFLTLAALCLFEVGVSSLRKAFWPTDIDVFQELQKDPVIRKRFEETVQNERDGHVAGAEVAKEKRSAEDQRAIQELLNRPRVMAPVNPIASGGLQSPNTLRKRSVTSTDHESGIEMKPSIPETLRFRHSVDIADVLGGRAGLD
jgi:phospholipid-translocating ATPase